MSRPHTAEIKNGSPEVLRRRAIFVSRTPMPSVTCWDNADGGKRSQSFEDPIPIEVNISGRPGTRKAILGRHGKRNTGIAISKCPNAPKIRNGESRAWPPLPPGEP